MDDSARLCISECQSPLDLAGRGGEVQAGCLGLAKSRPPSIAAYPQRQREGICRQTGCSRLLSRCSSLLLIYAAQHTNHEGVQPQQPSQQQPGQLVSRA